MSLESSFSISARQNEGTQPKGYTRELQGVYAIQLRKHREIFRKNWSTEFENIVTPSDFSRVKVIGTGAFGVVFLAKYLNTGKYYAMKMLDKEKIVAMKQINHTYYEKKILCAVDFSFLVEMKFFSKDNVYLYYILPFVHGGEMFGYLRSMERFSEAASKFYAAQVLLALEYLHACDLVYRDLKPENIMIDLRGYLKITDFGFCKVLHGRTFTLCGTPEYLAPEIILSKGYGVSVDWWAFGILIFEMNAGYPPFYAQDPMKIYEKIVDGKYNVPKIFTDELKDLVQGALQVDITRRIGCLKDGTLDFKAHIWFQDIDWEKITEGQVPAPFLPKVKSPCDTSNFDTYEDWKVKESAKNLYQNEFKDF